MAYQGNDFERAADEDEQDVDETNFKAQKDAILLAIEVSYSMLRRPQALESKDLDSPLHAALKCAYHLMQQRIISSPKDMMGILLFGTEKTKFQGSSAGYPNCYLLTDLDIPAAEDVKALKALTEEGEDDDEILAAAPGSVSMANVLFCANQIFTTKAANFGSRRLFIVTDNDNPRGPGPHGSDKAATSAAAVRAKDLYDLGITIELFPITTGGSTFEVSRFYDDIIYRGPDAEINESVVTSKSGDGLTLLKSLITNINSKQIPKRSLFNIPFEIAPGLRISVKGYNVLHRQAPARTCYVWLDGEKAQIATSETTRIADDSVRTVDKQEIKKAYKFGGDYVYFTPEEQKELRDFGSPIIRIIGFKPRHLFEKVRFAAVKKSTFIYPNEEDFIGSSRVFSALWRKLLDSKKVGLAWCLLRSNSQPMLAAIMPSKEGLDEGGVPYLPAGLWVYPIPTADDIRDVKHVKVDKECSNELKEDMRVIIKQLMFPKGRYNPKKYPNPSLQWHYKILQTLALEEEVPDKAEDLTEPKIRAIDKRAGGFIEDWAERLREEEDRASMTRSLKREVDEGVPERPAKQMKTASDQQRGSQSSWSAVQLREAVESGRVGSLTVAQLKDILADRGLSTGGKKAELIERIEQWLENDG